MEEEGAETLDRGGKVDGVNLKRIFLSFGREDVDETRLRKLSASTEGGGKNMR